MGYLLLFVVALIVLGPIAYYVGLRLRQGFNRQLANRDKARQKSKVAVLDTRVSDDRSAVVAELLDSLRHAPPSLEIVSFIRKHFIGSRETELALCLLKHAEQGDGSLGRVAMSVDDGPEVRQHIKRLSTPSRRKLFRTLDDNWNLDGLTFHQAVRDFNDADVMPIPNNAEIVGVIEDWGFEDVTIPSENDIGAEVFARYLADQPWAITIEAYKPGKSTTYEELVQFVFSNLDPPHDVENVRVDYDIDRVTQQVSWTVKGDDYCLQYDGKRTGLDVEWFFDEINKVLADREPNYQCVFAHYIDMHYVVFVAQIQRSLPLLQKYHLLAAPPC